MNPALFFGAAPVWSALPASAGIETLAELLVAVDVAVAAVAVAVLSFVAASAVVCFSSTLFSLVSSALLYLPSEGLVQRGSVSY